MVKLKLPTVNKSLGFYTTHEASRIACVPEWTVNSWKNEGIIIPSAGWVDEHKVIHIGYTFETVVYLRLIRIFRDRNITLLEAVKALNLIKERFGVPGKTWAQIKIFADSEDVYVYSENETDSYQTTVATRQHQYLAEFFFGTEFVHLKERADALLIPSEFINYVEIDPSFHNGLPLVMGTSVLTSTIHGFRKRGYAYKDVMSMYPFVDRNVMIGADKYEDYLDQCN